MLRQCTTRALVRFLVHLVVGMAMMFVQIVARLSSRSRFQHRYNTVCTVVVVVHFVFQKAIPNLDVTLVRQVRLVSIGS